MLIIPIGVSGSGKSYIGEFLKKDFDFNIICPDDIRKEITGNISDQSKNNEVFQITNNRIIKLLGEGKNVFFSATNVNCVKLRNFIDFVNSKVTVKILILWMLDSFNSYLCFSRIQKQLDNGEERSEIRDEEIINKQLINFKKTFEYKDLLKEFYPDIKYYSVSYFDGIKKDA
jgi:predicted kinase